jgi:diguanylate cyclase (GGDEF)-like protein
VHDEHLFRLTMSVGLAAWPQHGDSMDEILKAADDALYQAKRNGRNRVALAGGTTV